MNAGNYKVKLLSSTIRVDRNENPCDLYEYYEIVEGEFKGKIFETRTSIRGLVTEMSRRDIISIEKESEANEKSEDTKAEKQPEKDTGHTSEMKLEKIESFSGALGSNIEEGSRVEDRVEKPVDPARDKIGVGANLKKEGN